MKSPAKDGEPKKAKKSDMTLSGHIWASKNRWKLNGGNLKQTFCPGRIYEQGNREDAVSSMGGAALFGGGRAFEQSAGKG
jgi:hypothetical protein